MNEPFQITVKHQGEEVTYKARSERWGYSHRISVLVEETIIVFEPDEEDGYRALSVEKIDAAPLTLLQALAEKLTALSR